MNTLIDLVNRLGIFMIAAQMVIHFSAKKEYEKHISLLVGLMIIAICVVPIMSIGKISFDKDFHENMAAYGQSLDEALKSYEEMSDGLTSGADINLGTENNH